ncbi:hypothetical protein [Polyangium sp. 6x1]|uniref:hypothetical protein n=1 Tax=Polyangium sp. 6x1 TaxID=3042689 RepID=UPI0024824EF2|nr:hypothetical protein [Polyangium sp. 6x1]MDI1444529.1 hypothetical protein [Polyangium sp. 6x1]
MSRLTCAFVVSIVTTILMTPAARGEAPPTPPQHRWSVDARLGYATAWTTGQSFLGPATGLVGGWTFRVPVHVELGAAYHVGSIESAVNDTLVYWSRRQSVFVHAAIGYDRAMQAGRLLVRPRLLLGSFFIVDEAELGGAMREGIEPRFAFGPGVDILYRFGDLHAGIDARAFFVPSHVAAPIGGLFGVLGVER